MAKGKKTGGRDFQSGNPGRPKGSRNRLGEAFFQALCADFDEHGEAVIEAVRSQDPSTYVRVVAGLMPKELQVRRSLDDMDDDELDGLIATVRQALGAPVGPGVPEDREGEA